MFPPRSAGRRGGTWQAATRLGLIELALQSAMDAGAIVAKPISISSWILRALVSPATASAAASRCLPYFNTGVDHSANIREHKDLALGWAVRQRQITTGQYPR